MKLKTALVALSLICLFVSTTKGQESREERNKKFFHTLGTFTDPRDGQVYKTITFVREHHGGEIRRTWYAENVI